jgi:hypothetical protein
MGIGLLVITKKTVQVTSTYIMPVRSRSCIKTKLIKKTIASLINPADLRSCCNESNELDCCRCALGLVAFWNWFYAYCQMTPYDLSFSLSSNKCLLLYMKRFLSVWKTKFENRPIHVGFLVDKVALEKGFFSSTPVFPWVSIDQFCVLIYSSITSAHNPRN